MTDRTLQQKFANEFDRALDRLVRRAEDAIKNHGIEWQGVAATLRVARVSVRSKMHDEDRKVTA